MSWLTVLLVVAAVFIYDRAILAQHGRMTANGIFTYVQTVMAIGSMVMLEPDHRADAVYEWVLLYTLLAYLITSGWLLTALRAMPRLKARRSVQTYRPGPGMWVLMVLAAAVVVIYYRSVGYSAFVAGLSNAATGTDQQDVATLRLESYSGSRYLAPGYVNQFKNALLPALVVVAITYWLRSGMLRRRRLAALGWSAMALFGILGTGQRGAFVIFAVALGVYMLLLNKGKMPRGTTLAATLFLAVIVLSTIALGRSSDSVASDASLVTRSVVALGEFSDRVVAGNQSAGIYGWRYVYQYLEVSNGAEWRDSMLGLLPGAGGSDLANQIFAYRYGADRGTSPPSVWGSVYHNFGWWGVALSPIVLAGVMVGVSRTGMRDVERNSLELMGIAGTFAVLGFWAAGSPLFLLNSGLAVYLLMWRAGASLREGHDRRELLGVGRA